MPSYKHKSRAAQQDQYVACKHFHKDMQITGCQSNCPNQQGKRSLIVILDDRRHLQSTSKSRMPVTRAPKQSEDSVSAASEAAGEQQMIRAMRAFPPSVSYNTRVSQPLSASECSGPEDVSHDKYECSM